MAALFVTSNQFLRLKAKTSINYKALANQSAQIRSFGDGNVRIPYRWKCKDTIQDEFQERKWQMIKQIRT